MSRRIARILGLLLATALCLSGCGGNGDEIKLLREWSVDQDDHAKAVENTAIKRRVGMVTDIGGVNDQGFNQSAWDGLYMLHEKTGAMVKYLESDGEESFEPNFTTLAENGYALCWGVGYSCADAILKVAEQYPNINFAIIDNAFEQTPPNMSGIVFRAQEASFIVGYIAAKVTKTGKVGYIGGIEGEILDQFQYGFQAGVEYANLKKTAKVKYTVEYVGSFTDMEKGGAIADAMYADGCDVIYAAAGGAGLGVIESAGKNDKFVIGVDKDQSYLDKEHVLTSALKKVDAAIYQVSSDFLLGREVGGKTLSFGMTEGAVGIPENHDLYPDEVYDAALLLCDQIMAGDLVPPANKEEFEAFLKK